MRIVVITIASTFIAAFGMDATAHGHETGLQRVNTDVGPDLFTHGPDPAHPARRSRAAWTDPAAAQRPPVCATDFYQHVLYGRSAEAPDRLGTARAEIQAAIGRMNAHLNSESIASGGGGADYKFRCDAAGSVAVDGFVSQGTSFAEIVSAARTAGFNAPNADYLIFFDGRNGGACGISSYIADERLTADNANNTGGGYAAIYDGCWTAETPMHESGHLLGAVQYSAPHSTGTGGHCNEEADVMCYSPDGGDRNQAGYLSTCPGTPRFDCGFDDYFDSAPEAGEYLASHWNLGSPLNRMISFDGEPAAPPVAMGPKEQSLGATGKKKGMSGARGDWLFYEIRVPRRADRLKVRLFTSPAAEVVLFVRGRRRPTRETYECRSVVRNRHASCRLDEPRGRRWYAGVLTRGGPPGASFKIRAKAG